MTDQPSAVAANGRRADGTFAAGHHFAQGNPYAKRVAKLRAALFRAVKASDLREVITGLLNAAKEGDVAAAKELLSRLLGPPEAVDVLARLEKIEERLNAAQR